MEKDIEIIKESASDRSTKLIIVPLVASFFAILGLTISSSPGTGGPIVVMLFLLFIFIFVLSMSAAVLRMGMRFLGKINMSGIRILYTAVAIASGVVFLVGLQTLRQLQVIDLVLVLLFEALLNFYLLRRF